MKKPSELLPPADPSSPFLVDENLSPALAETLRGLGYAASAVREVGLKGRNDEEILAYLGRHAHVLVTCDLEFGERFYQQTLGAIGVIVLRSRFQGINRFRNILRNLHEQGVLAMDGLISSLVIATERKYRIRRRAEKP